MHNPEKDESVFSWLVVLKHHGSWLFLQFLEGGGFWLFVRRRVGGGT